MIELPREPSARTMSYQCHDQVDDGEGQVYLDWPLHVWALPPEVWYTQHSSSNREPGGKSNIVHQLHNVAENTNS